MKLTIETAREMYKSDVPSIKQFALDNYTKEELQENKFPKSWEELERIEGEFICGMSKIRNVKERRATDICDQNVIPKGLWKPVLELIKLLQLRDRYRELEGWDNPKNRAHVFMINKSQLISPFSFKKEKTRNAFFENFEKEIEIVYKIWE